MTPETKNKLLICGIILFPILLTPLGICFVIFGGGMRDYHLVYGLPAIAVIESLQITTQRVGKPMIYKINLQVTPPNAQPFASAAEEVVTAVNAPSFQSGHTLNVKYDPNDHARVLIVSWPVDSPDLQ